MTYYSALHYAAKAEKSATSAAENADRAERALLPDQSNNAGKFLTTDGTNPSWAEVNLTNKADSDLSNVASVASSFKEQSVGWGMPDYSAGISVSTTAGTIYTATKDGYFIVSCSTSNAYVFCIVDILDGNNNIVIPGIGNMVRYQNASGSVASFSIPLPKGYKVKISEVAGVNQCAFYPLKGVN